MSRVAINTGSVGNDGTGDSLRTAGGIINDNFAEIYSQFGDGTNLTPTWDKTAAGVNTTSNVGIGTTNPRFALEVGSVGSSGTSLFVNGNARVTGILTVGSSSIILDGNTNKILVGSGISFDGNTGVISATAFYAGGSIVSAGGESYWDQTEVGIHTLSNVGIGTTNPTSALTVKGNTSLETLSVSGVSTFSGDIKFSGTYGDNGALWDESEGALIFKDGREIRFGDYDGSGGDLRIYHDAGGSHSYIQDTGTGNLRIISNGDTIELLKGTSETMAKFNTDESVELYYDNSKKFETLGAGVTITGTTFTNQLNVSGVSTFSGRIVGPVRFSKDGSADASQNVEINNDGSYAFLNVGGSSSFYFDSPNTNIRNTFSGGRIRMDSPSGIDFEQYGLGGAYRARFDDNSVSLYSSNSKKFETLGTGVTVTGTTFTNQLSVSGVSTINGITVKGPGSTNVYIGQSVANSDLGGQQNTAVGYYALNNAINCNFNTAVGTQALSNLGINNPSTSFQRNTAVGTGAGQQLTYANNNTFIGDFCGSLITTGSSNTIIGKYSGNQNNLDIRTSSNNVVLSDGDGNIRLYANSSGNIGIGTTNPTADVTTSNTNVLAVGIVTANTFYGDVSNAAVGRWILGANGTSDYTFTGIGFTQTTNDPVLYLARGMVYEFVNNSGGAHPFEIRVSNGGAAYSDGVTNNAAATGVIRFEIPFNAPNTLYYQCTAHSGMGNTISVYPNTI